MIQRIQTLYMLLATLLCAASALIYILQSEPLYYGFAIQSFVGVFTLFNIFGYNNRRQQMRFTMMGIVLEMMFYVGLVGLYFLNSYTLPTCYMGITAAVLPAVAALCNYLAWRGIRADERLIRSIDRIR